MTEGSDDVTVTDQEFHIGNDHYRYTLRWVTTTAGKVNTIARLCKSQEDKDWADIPLKLAWNSKITGRLLTHWPPYEIDDLREEETSLTMVFHDPEYDEKPLLPFGLDVESEWHATYAPDARSWRLKRVRRLDYEGTDRHLRYCRPGS